MLRFSKIIVTGADGWLGTGLIKRLVKESKKKIIFTTKMKL